MSRSLSRVELVQLVSDQLAQREMRLLTLVVAVRNQLAKGQNIKGDLPAVVKSILQNLIANEKVREVDGTYISLLPHKVTRLMTPVA